MSRAPQKRAAFESPARLVRAEQAPADMPRPGSTVAGGALVLLRVAAGALWMVSLAFGWNGLVATLDFDGDPNTTSVDAEVSQLTLVVVLVVVAIPLVIDAVIAFLIIRGWNWPRVLVMVFSTLSIGAAFATWWAGGRDLHLNTTLIPVAIDILILLALSSRSASAYARRKQRPPASAEG